MATEQPTTEIRISNHTILRILSLVVAFVFGIYFIYAIRQALVLIGLSFFLAVALSPPVNYLSKKMPHHSRGLATGLAYLVTVFFLGFLMYSIIPPVVNQGQQLIQNLPAYINSLQTSDSFLARTARDLKIINSLQDVQGELVNQLSGTGEPIYNLFQRLFSSVAAILTVLVMTFFMLVEGPAWLEKFFALQPKEKREYRRQLAERMYRVVTGYVNGQLLIAAIAAISTLIVLTVLGVPFALPLATIVGTFGLIPLIGATLGSAIVIIVGLFQSLATGLILLIFFIIYQQVENNVLQPIIQSKTVNLSPLVIFVAAVIGIYIAGLLGALVAIPIAASLRVMVLDYLERNGYSLEAE